MQGGANGVSNTCLFAPMPYYKLNKGFFLGFLFKPLGGLHPPRGLNKKSVLYLLLIFLAIALKHVFWFGNKKNNRELRSCFEACNWVLHGCYMYEGFACVRS